MFDDCQYAAIVGLLHAAGNIRRRTDRWRKNRSHQLRHWTFACRDEFAPHQDFRLRSENHAYRRQSRRRTTRRWWWGRAGRGGGGGGRGGGGPRGPLFGGGGGPPGFSGGSDRRYNLSIGASARNVFNKVNFGTPSGILGSRFFDTPNGLQGGSFSNSSANRRIDLIATFSF